jgi:hypothetical protein
MTGAWPGVWADALNTETATIAAAQSRRLYRIIESSVVERTAAMPKTRFIVFISQAFDVCFFPLQNSQFYSSKRAIEPFMADDSLASVLE